MQYRLRTGMRQKKKKNKNRNMVRNKHQVLTLEVDRIRIDGHVARKHCTDSSDLCLFRASTATVVCYLLSRSMGWTASV